MRTLFLISLLFWNHFTGNPTGGAAGSAKVTGFGSFHAGPDFSLADSARFNFLYDSLELDSLKLSREAYREAVKGFLTMESTGTVPNSGVLSIVDFSLPSSEKRLFILDVYNGRLLFNTFVAHGRNSGTLMATRFSNRKNSYMSSLGFYLTGDSFHGRRGYSMYLEGLEKGLNDNAGERAIIMHPARYVSEEHIQQCGFLGRSEGCPALPRQFSEAIINTIKGGSCLFLYGSDYIQKSKILS